MFPFSVEPPALTRAGARNAGRGGHGTHTGDHRARVRWRPVRGRLLNLLTALSLLAFVASAVMWVRSYFVLDTVRWVHAHGPAVTGWTDFYSSAGALGVGRMTLSFRDAMPQPVQDWWARQQAGSTGWRRAPVRVRGQWAENLLPRRTSVARVHPVFAERQQFVQAPYWLVTLATLPLPAARARRWVLRRRRRAQNRCPDCGYDLRATPGLCPECGRQPV